MNKSYPIVLFMLFFSVGYSDILIHTLAEGSYLLPSNKEENFISAGEFLKRGKLTEYRHLNDADINIEQKLLYKDLKDYIKLKVNEYYFINLINVYSNPNSSVSPNRQVYFYCSISDNEKTLKHKYLIMDAETSELIAEGSGQSFKETN